MLQINSQTAECLKMTSQYNGMQRREYAICLHCLDCSPHGGRADIQVPEPDLRHDFVAGHERDFAVSTLVILVYVLGMVTGSALFGLVRSWIHGATRPP